MISGEEDQWVNTPASPISGRARYEGSSTIGSGFYPIGRSGFEGGSGGKENFNWDPRYFGGNMERLNCYAK